MTIEITGIISDINENSVTIVGNDLSKVFESRSLREEFECDEVEFHFNLNKTNEFRYLWKFITSQRKAKESGAHNIEEMLNACIGTITNLNASFLKARE